jgi:hypothetical protein
MIAGSAVKKAVSPVREALPVVCSTNQGTAIIASTLPTIEMPLAVSNAKSGTRFFKWINFSSPFNYALLLAKKAKGKNEVETALTDKEAQQLILFASLLAFSLLPSLLPSAQIYDTL